MENKEIEKLVQKDLDDGKYGRICSNETTFKNYVYPLLRLAYKQGLQDALECLPNVPSCPYCNGARVVVVGENLVSLDMAIDAGDRSLAGMHHSWVEDDCPRCEGHGAVQQVVELHTQVHDAITKKINEL